MNNFNIVFETIKDHCKEPEVRSEKCFYEVESLLVTSKAFLTTDYYLSVLHDLELITFCRKTKRIALTEKGMQQEKLFEPD